MKKLMTAGLGLMCAVAMNASQINFGNIVGDNTAANTSLNFGPVSGISVTATPYTDLGSGFVTGTGTPGATIQDYQSHGLGVCNSSEPGCTLPEHQVDNNAGYDFILLHFSAPITFLDVVLVNTGSSNSGPGLASADMDVTYYTCNGIGTVAGVTAGSAISGCAAALNDDTASAQAKDTGFTRLSQSTVLTDLLIGTRVAGDGTTDFFKLDAVDFNTAVPEPATFAFVGGALLALGGIRFRRNRVK